MTLPGAGPTVVLAISHAQVDRAKRRPFDEHTRRVVESLPGNEGYIGHSVRREFLGDKVWTVTVWKDEATLDAFVASPIHREAIRAGMPAVKRAQFVRLAWPASDLPPSWPDIKRRLRDVPMRDYAAPSTGAHAGPHARGGS